MTALMNTDSYKLSHKGFMDEGTTRIYSNLTPRSVARLPALHDRWDKKIVFYGLQIFILNYLVDEFNREFFNKPKQSAISKFKRLIDSYLGEDAVSMEHFEELHDLGYLPVEIKALPEGALIDARIPPWTISNTHEGFAWLTNYLETVASCETWKPMTTATIIRHYRQIVNEFALLTTGNLDGTEFQIHGFEFRGMSGRWDAAVNGSAMLLSTCGTDTVPALSLIEDYYFTDISKEFIATSVPASEHSIACLGTAVEGELESYRRWITESYPTGIVSLVSDTYDYWKVLTEYLPALKDDILNRPPNKLGLSKVVIRPDSGDPVKIITGLIDGVEYRRHRNGKAYPLEAWNGAAFKGGCDPIPEHVVKGSVEVLWDVFGGEVTEQGYKLLDSHIGLIYGDSITVERCYQILDRLEKKGFASKNVIFGVGSYTMQYLTRDSLGIAIKATYAEVDGVGYALYKDPVTDDGTKKSAKGLLKIIKNVAGDYVLLEYASEAEEKEGELKTVFKDGEVLIKHKFSEIRQRLWS